MGRLSDVSSTEKVYHRIGTSHEGRARTRQQEPAEEVICSTNAVTAGGCGTLELYKKGGSERSADTLEMAQSLQPGKGGVPVVLIDLLNMLVEERTAWSDGQIFSLVPKHKSFSKPKLRWDSGRGKNMQTFRLSDIKTVNLLTSWSPEQHEPAPPWRNSLRELCPMSPLMICIRFDSGVAVNLACFTKKATRALHTFLSQHATAIPATLRALCHEASGRKIISVGAKATSYKENSDGIKDVNSKKRRSPKAPKRAASHVYSRLVHLLRDSLSETRPPPPKEHFGPIYLKVQKTLDRSSTPLSLRNDTSSSRHGWQKPKINAERQQKTLIDKDATKGPSPDKEVPSPVTLESSAQGGISDAVPLKPSCYVVRENESARLEDALAMDPSPGLAGGPTTVIFDPEANGKSVLAAAVVQDASVNTWYPGGVIWLRAGRAANGRLLQMMELAIAQVTEVISRKTGQTTRSHAPETYNNEGGASDYLASLLVRTCVGGARGVLLVLDDVWDAGVIRAFRAVGLSLLVTTRKPMITNLATEKLPGSKRLVGPLGPMSHEQAMATATKAAMALLYQHKDIKEVVDSTGRCPLAVGAVASILKQAEGPLHWRKYTTMIRRILSGLQKWRAVPQISPGEAYEDRIIASFAVSLSTMPERYQVLFSALWVVPCGIPVTCNLLSKIWEISKRKTILVAEALEDRCLLERHAPGTFILHYEAAKFLRQPPGYVGGAWVGSKLQGQARTRVLKLLYEYVGSLDTLSDHLKRRNLWGLAELWKACEAEETQASPHSHMSCRIYEMQLDRLRQAAGICPSADNRAKPPPKKLVWTATCVLARALEMVADFQELVGCCDPSRLYRESIESFKKSLDLAVDQGSDGVNASDLDSLKLSSERTALKLDVLLLKNGKAREAPDLNRTCLAFTIAERMGRGDTRADEGGSTIQPQLDVAVGYLLGMAETLTQGKDVEKAQALFEDLTLILRKLYNQEACLCLEARIKMKLAPMMARAGRLDEAKALNDQCLLDVSKAFGADHPVMARVWDQRGLLLNLEKNIDAASACVLEALKIREAVFGAGDALTKLDSEKVAGTSVEAMCQNKRHGSVEKRVMDTSAVLCCTDDQDSKIVSGPTTDCQPTSIPKPLLPYPSYKIVADCDPKAVSPPSMPKKSSTQLVSPWPPKPWVGFESVRQFGPTPTTFSSTDADVRLNVGPGCLKEDQPIGPITVVMDQLYLVECNDSCFLASVTVECQPSGSVFEVPLELDFRVGGPLDEYGESDCDPRTLDRELREEVMAMLRETYEVLRRDKEEDAWTLTDQETTSVVYDDGMFFLRTSVDHFSQWCLGRSINPQSPYDDQVVTWPRRPGRKEMEFVNATDRTLLFLVLPTTWTNGAVNSIATGLNVENIGMHLAISKAIEQSILEEATQPQVFQLKCPDMNGPLRAGQMCPTCTCWLSESTGYEARVALMTIDGPFVAVWNYRIIRHRTRVVILPGQFSDGMVPLLGRHKYDDLGQGSMCPLNIALEAMAKSFQRTDETTAVSRISSNGVHARLEAEHHTNDR